MTTTTTIRFPNASGQQLSARLQRPDGTPRGWCILAHCFTCSKDLKPLGYISAAFLAHGVGVLRFDFTGLGQSEGQFEDTNFSSNLEDLLAAAEFLRAHEVGPLLLVGHSLGGAAALAVAHRIPEVVAVATIGAPSDPEHVVRHLEEHRHEIESRGEAEVEIAGRSFRIRRQLLDDLAAHTLEEHIENLGRPLLVLHSPADEVVSIENGQRIFERARYPKSFVSLDGADHLLLDARDSRYVGALLASWVERYLLPAEAPIVESLPAGEVWTELGAEGFTTLVRAGRHELLADEPEAVGGGDCGPSPYDYLLAGLGACTAMTLRMYATRKAWPLDGVHVRLRHERIHATDCADCATTSGKISRIERNIELTGPLDQAQQQRLLEIADRCPVHRTLSEEIEIVTTADRGKA